MYEGEVFTYRNDRAPRAVATNRQQRPAAPDYRQSEGRTERRTDARTGAPDPDERIDKLERRSARLEEHLGQLSGLVQRLSEAVEALEGLEPARAKAAAEPARPFNEAARTFKEPVRTSHEPALEAPKVTVQMQSHKAGQPAPPPPSDVKVSLFAGASAEAILGQVRVTQQS